MTCPGPAAGAAPATHSNPLVVLPDLNLRLRPTLLQLQPGTRIVSRNYHMGDWEPDRHTRVGHAEVYFWTVPETLPAHLRQ